MKPPASRAFTGAAVHTWTVFILAGGRSRRMGRDKSRIQINGATLLDRVKKIAGSRGYPVNTIRTDAVANCGPLSGIYTGLLRAKTPWCLFLGCDMPLISCETLDEIVSKTEQSSNSVFTQSEHGFGFPLSISRDSSDSIRTLMREGKRSIFSAAKVLRANSFQLPKHRHKELFNTNTPEELQQLVSVIKSRET